MSARARGTALAGAVLLVALIVAAVIVLPRWVGRSALPAPAPSASPTASVTPSAEPTPEPDDAAHRLLATTDDPRACAISFSGDDIADEPVLRTQGLLYDELPIPHREGSVFAGWYDTPEDAAALAIPGRINGSKEVACTDRLRTVYAAWTTPEADAAENAEVPILMYHQFTTKPEGEDNWLRGNYVYIGDWEAHLHYIAEQGFYLPTWDELSAYIDGDLFLPRHSVIVTDDDADSSWLELAVPIVEKEKVLTTSFVITINGAGPDLTPYVLKRSHTHDMHSAGENGQGRIVNWSLEQIVADLETSAQVLGGVKEVVAYPYGHYNDTAKQGVADAGFDMARTIEQGYVSIGSDKLALPCIRINYGMTVQDLAALIG
ncbi:MAG: polysaccharide deacetylase family protein [Microbacterium sp.]